MNDHAKLWVEALRSGEYSQTKNQLRDDVGYCCLGVACSLYREETGFGRWTKDGGDYYFSLDSSGSGNSASLPDQVKAWLGLADYMGRYGDDDALSQDNDRGLPFVEIADIIESEPPGLFR